MSARAFLKAQDEGAAAVELALTAPVFIALIFGALQGATMLWTQLGLQQATERAARCAAINATLCGTAELVQAYAATQALSANLPASNFTLTSATCGAVVSGEANVKFVTLNVTLSARSCFPK